MPLYDFNVIPSNDPKKNQDMIIHMAKLGYDGIAWNSFCAKPPANNRDKLPSPYCVSFEADDNATTKLNQFSTKNNYLLTKFNAIQDHYTPLTPSKTDLNDAHNATIFSNQNHSENQHTPKHSITTPPPLAFQQYSRLTVQVDDLSQANLVQIGREKDKGKGYCGFDIIAVVPGNEKVLHHFLHNNDCDIISLDLSKKLPFQFKPQFTRMAIEKGIYFEINISPLLSQDQNIRRTFLGQFQNVLFATRGKQLIVTSGASDVTQCKTVGDIKHMLLALGAPIQQISNYSNVNLYHVMQHSLTRKVHKAAIAVHIALKNKVVVDGDKNGKLDDGKGRDVGDGRRNNFEKKNNPHNDGNQRNYNTNNDNNHNNHHNNHHDRHKKPRFNK
jgi:RNase P/RNase MRP subunit p30